MRWITEKLFCVPSGYFQVRKVTCILLLKLDMTAFDNVPHCLIPYRGGGHIANTSSAATSLGPKVFERFDDKQFILAPYPHPLTCSRYYYLPENVPFARYQRFAYFIIGATPHFWECYTGGDVGMAINYDQ